MSGGKWQWAHMNVQIIKLVIAGHAKKTEGVHNQQKSF
jgi:hypothetical protein